jgi:hypothetical protein
MDSTRAAAQAKRDAGTMARRWASAPKVDLAKLSTWAKDASGKYGIVPKPAAGAPKPAAPAMTNYQATKPPTEAQLRNQRQEQAAGAARNYSSRRTELAAKGKTDTL